MATTRRFTVPLTGWATEAKKLHGTLLIDPKEGEEELVCSRVYSVYNVGTNIVVEAVYEKPDPLVVEQHPAVPANLKRPV